MERVKKKVCVVLRIRPVIYNEALDNPKVKCSVIHVHPGKKKVTLRKEGVFDKEFDLDAIAHYKTYSQQHFYEEFCEERVLDAFKGFSSTFIAYGSVLYYSIGRLDQGRLIVCLEVK